MNPPVPIALVVTGDVDAKTARQYIPAQFLGGVATGLLWRHLWPRPTPIDRLKPKPGDDCPLEESPVES